MVELSAQSDVVDVGWHCLASISVGLRRAMLGDI
jgi:hypothetical protein